MSDQYKDKRATGSFYTPSYIVDFMVDRVYHYLNQENRVDYSSFSAYNRSISKLFFCDPSLGNGNFIIGLMKRVWADLKRFSSTKQEDINEFFRNFFENNVYGIELNPNALQECKERISFFFPQLKKSSFDNLKVGNSIVNSDSAEILNSEDASKLNSFNWKEEFKSIKSFDIIIGNPPYYNLKKMGLVDENARLLFHYLKNAESWKRYFRASSDIYYYFIVQALKNLSKQGLLSYIIPNYWIENKYADILRNFILQHQILELIDFNNLRIFKDNGKWLNVTSCITIIQNSSLKKNIKVMRNISKTLLENYKNERDSVTNYYFDVDYKTLNKQKWILSPYTDLLEKITKNNYCSRLGDHARIIQGMSPGVKDIFIMSQSKAEKLALEKEVLVPFISNSDIKRWNVFNQSSKVAILPSKIDNLDDFENVKRYLETNRTKLTLGADRKRLINSEKIRWFDFSVYRNIETFTDINTKIMVPYRGLFPRFGLDEKGSYGATDIYAIIPKRKEDLYFLLGILNSKIIHFWYSEAGKRKGKMLEFFSDPLRRIPIVESDDMKDLTKYVKQILKIVGDTTNNQEIDEIEETINTLVCKAYGIDNSVIETILSSKNFVSTK